MLPAPGIFTPEARKGQLLDTATKFLLDHVSQVEPALDAWTGGPKGRNATNLTRLLQKPDRKAKLARGTRRVAWRPGGREPQDDAQCFRCSVS